MHFCVEMPVLYATARFDAQERVLVGRPAPCAHPPSLGGLMTARVRRDLCELFGRLARVLRSGSIASKLVGSAFDRKQTLDGLKVLSRQRGKYGI